MSSANVTSLDVLRHLRSVLICYGEECGQTIIGLDMELRRGLQFLLDEQPKFWKSEERRLHDRVLEARQELSRARGMGMKGETPSCSEQKHALERAIAQLRHAEDKSKITKHWGRVIEHEAREFQGRSNQLSSMLEGELPKAIALLDRAITALEGYLSVSPGAYASGSPRAAATPPSPEADDASR